MDAEDSPSVELREITKDNYLEILRLAVHESQQRFVARNAVSIAQAKFHPEAWCRGIYAGDVPVGFVMLSDERDPPCYSLWRFMIDVRHQGKGYGRSAIEALVAHVRTLPGADKLLTSVVEGEGGPKGFYESLGFTSTGEYDDGELVLSRPL